MGDLSTTLGTYDATQGTTPREYFIKAYRSVRMGAALIDDEDLAAAVRYAHDVANVDSHLLADEMCISTPGMRRWMDGKNLPHPAVRQGVLDGIVNALCRK